MIQRWVGSLELAASILENRVTSKKGKRPLKDKRPILRGCRLVLSFLVSFIQHIRAVVPNHRYLIEVDYSSSQFKSAKLKDKEIKKYTRNVTEGLDLVLGIL